jgi:hypothetical protein
MPAVAFASLDWSAVVMPGSTTPVRLARLPRTDDAAFRAFVAFPAGWTRAEAGHYPVAEEFLVLEGDLALNETTWRAGGFAFITANRTRSMLRSESGALVFAWFAAAPRWCPGDAAEPALANDVVFAHWREAPEYALAGTGFGRRLYAGPEHATWILARRHVAALAASGTKCETFGLLERTWRSDTTHAPGEDQDEPVLLRRAGPAA